MVFNATFNNISVISWQPVFLVVEIEVSEENHQPAASHWQTLSHNVVSSTPCLSGIQTYKVCGDMYCRLFEICRTERAENHKDRQYCQVCRSRVSEKNFCLCILFCTGNWNCNSQVCRNDHGQLGIRFCFKWHLLLKHATVSMVIPLIIVFL